MKKLVAIRCIVDHYSGYGHFSRCLAIANYFLKRHYDVIFLINNNSYLKKELSKNKLNYSIISKFKTKSLEGKFLNKFIFENHISCILIDMREFSEALSKEINNSKCLVVVIDDSSVTNVYSNILLNGTPIKQFHKYKKSNKKARLLIGSKYFLTKPEFANNKKNLSEIKSKKKYDVVVSCGGSDLNELTWKITKQITSISNIKIQVITGPLMKQKFLNNMKKDVKIVHSPKKIWNIFKKADLVICTSGSTLFELAIQGIPCINIAAVKHQTLYGSKFSDSGFGIYMGFWSKLNFSKFNLITEELLSNTSQRKRMSSVGKKLVDGNGLKRFEKVISSMIN